MDEPRVIIVHLRRPTSNPGETRADPYWEVGSFGCTGCHRRNLMHPKSASKLEGAHLAFAQGGSLGFRLVLLTPPIKIVQWADRCEARWKPARMPFKYKDAPVLVRNSDGATDFPSLKRLIESSRRSTLEAGFSSRFRSRARPLEDKCAAEIISVFKEWSATKSAARAMRYVEALPWDPPKIDNARKRSYHASLKELRAELRGRNGTGKRRCCGSKRKCVGGGAKRKKMPPRCGVGR